MKIFGQLIEIPQNTYPCMRTVNGGEVSVLYSHLTNPEQMTKDGLIFEISSANGLERLRELRAFMTSNSSQFLPVIAHGLLPILETFDCYSPNQRSHIGQEIISGDSTSYTHNQIQPIVGHSGIVLGDEIDYLQIQIYQEGLFSNKSRQELILSLTEPTVMERDGRIYPRPYAAAIAGTLQLLSNLIDSEEVNRKL